MSEVHARVHTRILELRKEKSRDAARSRRGKENYEFYELAKMLPLPAAITSQLDKASIIRLSISYLRLRDFALHGNPTWVRDGLGPNKAVKGGPHRRRGAPLAGDPFETHQGMHILQSLDGFAFNLANDGRFLYVSETVSIYLGLSQVEMTGCSIFDYVHQQDHPELAEHLGLCLPHSSSCGVPSPGSGSDEGSSAGRSSSPIHERAYIMNPNPSKGYSRSFCLRMKSTLTKRGVHVKCSGYRVVHIQGSHRLQFSYSMTRKHPPPVMGFVGLAVALPPPTITELRIDNDTFISRLSPDFKVIYCEPIVSELMDLSAEDLTSSSLYSFCHAADLAKLRNSHVELLTKSQILTDYYRLMNRKGGYVWIQTCATIIYNSKSTEDQSIICINYVLSNVEAENCVMDMRQLKQSSSSSSTSGLDQPDLKDHSLDAELDEGLEEKKTSGRSSGHGHGDLAARSSTSSVSDKPLPSSPSDQSSLQELPPLPRQSSDPHPDPQESAVDALISMSSAAAPGQQQQQQPLERGGDGKNSRRKMEKPRKRKKDVEQLLGDVEEGGGGGKAGRGSDLGDLMESGGLRGMGGSGSPSPQHQQVGGQGGRGPSPMAQDLSLKSPGHPLPCASPSDSASAWQRGGEGGDSGACPGVITSSSVRELEAVMNRHLPSSSSSSSASSSCADSGFKSVVAASDKGYGGQQQAQKKSTIQWVGSSSSSQASSSSSSGPENHPASSLLRSLYASRESVIRTSSTRPPSYYGEGSAPSMLTPPGSEAHPPSFSKPSSSALPPAAYPPPQSYSSSPLSVSMPSAPLDSFGMTPPSSVSPQDKMQSPFSELPAYSDQPGSAAACGGLLSDSLSAASRLKGGGSHHPHPHHYPAFPPSASPAAMPGADYGVGKNYYPVHAYHPASSAAPYPDLTPHNAAPLNYEQCARTVLPWYPISYSS